MYFGRNAYDSATLNEAQTRLQAFQGATAISSNQYFGREEDEELLDRAAEAGLLGDGSLSGLEMAAKDAISRLMANPDVQNIGESIRSGALKVIPMCYSSLACLADRYCSFLTIWHKCLNVDLICGLFTVLLSCCFLTRAKIYPISCRPE